MRDLTIGLLFPVSGPSGDTARQCVEAAHLAVQMFPVDGWRIRVVEGDPHPPEKAAAEAERLVRQEGARVIVGTLLSHLCLPASEVADRLGAAYWEAIASADEVTTRGLRNLFRLDGHATLFGGTAVDHVAEVLAPAWGLRPAQIPVATIVEDTAFPRSFGQACAARARERGFPVVAEVSCGVEEEDIVPKLAEARRAAPAVVLSAGFGRVVPRVWRGLRERPLGARALVGISGWAFPREPDLKASGFEGVFAVAAPYLFSMDRGGLRPDMRDLLESWWARSATPAAQDVAVDRDLVFAAMYVLLRHVLPMAASADADALGEAARKVDLPLGATPVGNGVRFDASGNNQRAYAIVMQWQGGRRLTVSPRRFATAAPVTEPQAV